jgi:hypothetical protein
VFPVERVQTSRLDRRGDAVTALRTEDPAVAIAMGRCLTARSLATGTQAFRPSLRHPRECGWCPYPLEELQAAVIEFNNWAQFNDRLGTTGRHATRHFAHEISDDEREARIVAAQALVDEAPSKPVAAVEAPEPHVQEEVIAWLK